MLPNVVSFVLVLYRLSCHAVKMAIVVLFFIILHVAEQKINRNLTEGCYDNLIISKMFSKFRIQNFGIQKYWNSKVSNSKLSNLKFSNLTVWNSKVSDLKILNSILTKTTFFKLFVGI